MGYVIYSATDNAFMSAHNAVNNNVFWFTYRIQDAKEFQSRGEANVWVANMIKRYIKVKKKPILLVREKNTFQNK